MVDRYVPTGLPKPSERPQLPRPQSIGARTAYRLSLSRRNAKLKTMTLDYAGVAAPVPVPRRPGHPRHRHAIHLLQHHRRPRQHAVNAGVAPPPNLRCIRLNPRFQNMQSSFIQLGWGGLDDLSKFNISLSKPWPRYNSACKAQSSFHGVFLLDTHTNSS